MTAPTPQPVPVRTPEDADAVRGLLRAYAELRGHDRALGAFAEELAHLTTRDYAPPGGDLWLVRVDGEAAGCVAIRRLGAETCEMKRMFVLPRFQGRGLGVALIDAALEGARRRGCRRMVLDTHPWMLAAQVLYARAGFTEIPRYNDNPTPGIRFFGCELRR